VRETNLFRNFFEIDDCHNESIDSSFDRPNTSLVESPPTSQFNPNYL
jgi:hypothetical protein